MIADTINRHDKIALMYSGGKDSTACLYLLKEWWNKIHVVWVNSGAAFPEIIDFMAEMRQKLPNFIEVKSNQPDYVQAFGHPTEVLPVNYTALGQIIGEPQPVKLNSYLDCCATNIWRPAMDAARAVGATLIIRGQKNCDAKKAPIKSGSVHDGVEYFFPIEAWSHDEVRDYLGQQDFVVPPYYHLLASSLDCWNCTAYCYEHGDKLKYMKENHPALHDKYKEKLEQIHAAIKSETIPLLNLIGEK